MTLENEARGYYMEGGAHKSSKLGKGVENRNYLLLVCDYTEASE